MGAKVTVCGPPTLIPRGMELLGCDVAYTLDDLPSADVVYALRMQKERMSDSFVPSLREYAAQYQINGRRLSARQVLMHPGPVNRGVELAAEVIDSPQAVIGQQVEAGVVVRMAVLYELLAGRSAPQPALKSAHGGTTSWTSSTQPPVPSGARGAMPDATRPPSDAARRRPDPRRARARPARGIDARLDVLVRGGEIAEIGEDLEADVEVIDGEGKHLFPGFVDPHVHLRTPGQEHKEDLETPARARPPRAASSPSSRCRTRTRPSTPPRSCAACARPPAARRACPSASWPRSRPACRARR